MMSSDVVELPLVIFEEFYLAGYSTERECPKIIVKQFFASCVRNFVNIYSTQYILKFKNEFQDSVDDGGF